MILFFLLFHIISITELTRSFISPLPLHLQMNSEELELIFATFDVKKVPAYELVQIAHSIHTNENGKCVRFMVFDEKVELKLQKSDRRLFSLNTPIWWATTNGQNVEYKRIAPGAIHDSIEFYEDPNNMAGIGIKNDSQGNFEFTGYIQQRLILKKVPESVYDIWTQLFNKSQHRVFRSLENGVHTDFHIVINRSISDDAPFRSRIHSKGLRKRDIEQPYHGPSRIYFRTLIFVDFNKFYVSNRDVHFYELLIYLVCFWNAVDMKLHEFVNPSIRLHITGIVIRKSVQQGGNSIWMKHGVTSARESIDSFRLFLEQNDPLPGYWDIAISQSNISIDGEDPSEEHMSGIAYIGTTCATNRSEWSFWSLALVEDKQDFSGINVAAHEIGHLFGANHDEAKDAMCNPFGYIMTPVFKHPELQSGSWSWCSRTEISRRIRFHAEHCWNGTPTVYRDDLIPELLPGHITGINDQCVFRGHHSACNIKETTCDNLFCEMKRSEGIFSLFGISDSNPTCVDVGPPFAGTFCGEDMHCKYQICVPRSNCDEKKSIKHV